MTTKTKKISQQDHDELAWIHSAAHIALNKKATRPIIIDVRGQTSYTDYFLLLSTQSERQTQAIASALEDELKKNGLKVLGVEGRGSGFWVLLDFDFFIVHVFHESARQYYNFEQIWQKAPQIEFDESIALKHLESPA